MSATRTAATTAADFVWRSTRGALVALALGAVAALGGRGLADAGVSTTWIWLWAIAAFAAFAGGLTFWAISAPERWTAATPATAKRPTSTAGPTALASTETVTYWYAAGLTLLLNMLATALLIASIDIAGYVWSYAPAAAVCNLAGYLVVLGTLRHPTTGHRTGQIQDT
jgi:hypothetical protein